VSKGRCLSARGGGRGPVQAEEAQARSISLSLSLSLSLSTRQRARAACPAGPRGRHVAVTGRSALLPIWCDSCLSRRPHPTMAPSPVPGPASTSLGSCRPRSRPLGGRAEPPSGSSLARSASPAWGWT
jgi:hypothetical protein